MRRAKSSIGLGSKFVDEDDRRNASSRRAVSSCSVDVRDFEFSADGRRAVELRTDVEQDRFQLGGVRPLFSLPLHRKAHAVDAPSQILEGTGIDRGRPPESLVHARRELLHATFDRIQSRCRGRPLDL